MDESDKIREAYRHCEALVRVEDKDRYLASLFAPAAKRSYLFALYAFDLEIARVRMLVREPMAGEIRLQWWHDALTGERAGEAAASPVMIALQGAARATGVGLEPLLAAVDARQAELYGDPAENAATAVFRVAARLLGAEGDAVDAAAETAGQATIFATEPHDPEKARSAYAAFRAQVASLPSEALPAFLPVSLVPLRLRTREPSQWWRQIVLARAAWFGFPSP